ncbi:MAG: head maturation protease, ClpP-related [Flavobacteriales bacterium]
MSKLLNIKNQTADSIDLLIDTEIGSYGVSAKGFISEVKNAGVKNINLTINSVGGSVFDAFAIYDFLVSPQNNFNVSVKIEGLAASAATIIALADRKKPKMTENSFFMIHNPSLLVMNFSDMEASDLREQAKEFESTADFLDSIKNRLASIYSNITGKSKAKINQMMDDETWMDAQEALSNGFISSIEKGVAIAAMADEQTLKKYGYNKASYINNKTNSEMDIKNEITELKDLVKSLFTSKKEEVSNVVTEVKILDNEEVKNKIASIESVIASHETEVNNKIQEIEELKNKLSALEDENALLKASKSEIPAAQNTANTEPQNSEKGAFAQWLIKAAQNR